MSKETININISQLIGEIKVDVICSKNEPKYYTDLDELKRNVQKTVQEAVIEGLTGSNVTVKSVIQKEIATVMERLNENVNH